jgi:riboflavin synthase
MFTGIIEEVGEVASFEEQDTGARLTITCSGILADAVTGSSIAVNGTCITATDLTPHSFSADLSPETLARTNLACLHSGSLVNLERPLRANSRLDGHFVLGHVDATAEIASLEALGNENWWLRIFIPADLDRYIVSKGSLAIDGISLTVAELDGKMAGFTIIPHTFQNTNLHSRRPGARVNLEVDILAKHLEKLTAKNGV